MSDGILRDKGRGQTGEGLRGRTGKKLRDRQRLAPAQGVTSKSPTMSGRPAEGSFANLWSIDFKKVLMMSVAWYSL